jgi:hypothetical protein
LHYTLAVACASRNDFDELRQHVDAFAVLTDDSHDLAWIAPFDAVLATTDGRDAAAVLAEALAVPGLTTLERANLHLYDALMRNLPPASDTEAALLAVRTATEARLVGLAVTYAFLAMSLRESDPEGALVALTRAEEIAADSDDSFIVASASAWGSLATLGLPIGAAATHLAHRLDRLQSYFGNSAAALLTLCLCVLRRAGSPAADPLHAFLFAAPTGAAVARTIDPALPDPDPVAAPPTTFDDAVALTRAALRALAVEAEGAT